MAYQHQLTRNAGHPFTREAGWDMLEVQAESEAELSAYIAAAAKKFWKVWIRDNTGARRAALYKPSNAAVDWNDEPGSTGLSKLLAGVDMRANQFHIDVVLATFAHQLRTTTSLTDLVNRWSGALGAYGSSGKAVADVTAGLVGAVPALNECLRDVSAPPEPSLWREHAQQALTTAELDMSIEAPEPRQDTRRRPPRRP
jgi:hypothetical protein